MNIKSNKNKKQTTSSSNNGQTDQLETIDQSLVVDDKVEQELELLLGQDENLTNEEDGQVIEGTLVTDDDQKEELGQDENLTNNEEIGDDQPEDEQVIEQPKLEDMDKDQLLDMIKLLVTTVEELKSAQPKTAQPSNGGVLNTNGDKKADHARVIWNEEQVKTPGICPVRAVVIKRLIAECGLTDKGAPTYFQNMKKKAGYVQSK